MKCAYHPEREPMGGCVVCGRLICVECKALLGGKIYCTPCADKIFVQGKVETIQPEKKEVAAPRQQPATVKVTVPKQQPKMEVQEVVISKPEPTIQTSSSNTSGQGATSVLPAELKGWNWGAFFLNWIWGIGNNVWIALLSFVLGFIWAIVLGIKGNEWAWQHKKWDSIEHFKRTQRTWRKWGFVLFIVGVAIGILYIIIAVVLVVTGIGELGF
jgi:hypothetical protein